MRAMSTLLFVLAAGLLVYGVVRARSDCTDAGGLAVFDATARVVCLRADAKLMDLP